LEARKLPGGTVTLLFTDIEGSTRMLQELGREAYVRALTAHRQLLREAFSSHGGVEVEMQGDSFHFAFPYARDAVAAAVAGQRALHEHTWESQPITVRIGLHTGEPVQADGLYAGLDVHRAARVMSAGHGGQVLLSQQTAELVDGELPTQITLLDLGEHRLKDLTAPQRLYQALADGLPTEFAPLKTLVGRATNLPVQVRRLIGRTTELAEVTGRLRQEGTRLLTLTGPGGTGKTRLALQAAAELVDDFPEGVFFVSLAPVEEADLVLPTIAQTLRLRDEPGSALEETLAAYLAGKRLLLVLDNFERVIEAAAEVARLLARTPRLAVLATSREPLCISGESRYPVDTLAEQDAVALFAERATAAEPGFALTDENLVRITSICARLDRLPLAIELAAARIGVLSPEALERRLDLTLLTGGARDADERQRTLRATIAWSYDLLSEEEKRLFASVSVFVDGCRIDGAEIVCDPDRTLGVDVFDGLCSLVAKNLLRRRDDADGEPRFWMLQTIREYAGERLAESSGGATLLERHARWCCDLAHSAAQGLHGNRQLEWMQRLVVEYENLRAALAWTLANDGDAGLELVGDLGEFWDLRGELSEGRHWVSAMLDAHPSGAPRARAWAALADGMLALTVGDFSHSLEQCLDAVHVARELDDHHLLARALTEAAWVLSLGLNEPERAARLCDEAFELATEHAHPWLVAYITHCRANTVHDEASWQLLAEAERLYRSLGDSVYRARVVGTYGWTLLSAGAIERATGYLADSVVLSEEIDDIVQLANGCTDLAVCRFLAGDVDGAVSNLDRSIRILSRVRARRMAAEALVLAAAIAWQRGTREDALQLVGAARRLIEQAGSALNPIEERLLDFTGEAISAADIAALKAGLSLDLDAALEQALAVLAAGDGAVVASA
jgi:predicted ATPase/class 3 adenylate cyclase